ncbi:ATP-binding protein [Chrysiogenes arsenatis]|uniref:ATP-binding protein n=1 Tax=Chrysiogenes arsenatis TaxID=309797 RepID=UPI0004186019|nr:ATP-binding protein [Chrysiogenes arsenatis]
MTETIRRYLLIVFFLVTLVLFGVFTAFSLHINGVLEEQLRERGRAFFNEIVLVRQWVAKHGGVFVRERPGVESNPFLEHIHGLDATLTSGNGVRYVMRNPALVTAEVSELAALKGIFQFHMTSLSPLNPGNTPDSIEREALEAFRTGLKEFIHFERDTKRATLRQPPMAQTSYRYIAPLPVEAECMRCHTEYEVGDIRGALSITIPVDDVIDKMRTSHLLLIISGSGVILIMIILLLSASFPFLRRVNDRYHITESLFQESRTKYLSLFDNATDPIFVVEPDEDCTGCRLREVNRSLCQLLQLPREELLELHLSRFVCKESREALRTTFHHLLAHPDEPVLLNARLKRTDETCIDVEIHAHIVEYKNQRFIMATARDIRERLRLDEERRYQEQMLIQQSKMAAMGEMLNNIAHQWRQPLTGLSLMLQDLRKNARKGVCNAQEVEAVTEQGVAAINFLSQTINDFRMFLRPSKEKMLFDLDQTIMHVIPFIRPNIQSHGIQLRFSPDGKPKRTYGYPNELKQVVINILTNAKDAIIEARHNQQADLIGIIEITCEEHENHWKIIISNDGAAIPPHLHEKIFDNFYSTKGSENGTGIGLYMSRTIIEKHMGGKLWVRNHNNRVEFIIELIQGNAL